MSADTAPALAPCPLCGKSAGYSLDEGSTFRWWSVDCRNCGSTLNECRSDQNSQFGVTPPERWPAADEVWKRAGAYAEGLRLELESTRQQLRQIAAMAAGDAK